MIRCISSANNSPTFESIEGNGLQYKILSQSPSKYHEEPSKVEPIGAILYELCRGQMSIILLFWSYRYVIA